MLCIKSTSNDPYFNLATEEYLLKNSTEDIFMLYVNDPSLIIGKHQNTISEINIEYALSKNIKVARRLSGGGTVYHDRGNLNFCFISTTEGDNKVNFKRYTRPILELLWHLGLNARMGGRNDLIAEGFKISGNAEHIYRNRVLHHGTLLYDSNLDELSKLLKVNLTRFKDKSVQSKRSQVINISDILEKKITFDSFTNKIFKRQMLLPGSQKYSLTANDKEQINKLVEFKFRTWEWNYGYSPKYLYRNSVVINDCQIELQLNVEKGIIITVEVKFNGMKTDLPLDIIGKKHFPSDLDYLNSSEFEYKEIKIRGEWIYKLIF